MPTLGDRLREAGARLAEDGTDRIPPWLMTIGVAGWLLIGAAGALWLFAWFMAASSSISVPLVLALVIGMVAYPLCGYMTERGVPRSVAAGIVLLLLAAVAVGVVWATLAGVGSQIPNIVTQLQRGFAEISAQLHIRGVELEMIRSFIQSLQASPASAVDTLNPLVTGLFSSVGSFLTNGVSGIISLLFGLFIGVTLLYYVLADFPVVSRWLGSHMAGVPTEIGEGIIEDAVTAMRAFFRASTVSGLVVAVVIGLAMAVLGVPLALPVALVTFLTAYIPFFGAIFSGAFAFIVALGSNGLGPAIILLLVVLLAQNILQTIINARLMGDSMNLHPLVVLVVTMLGGIFGGLLGAALGAPVTALLVNAAKRLSAAFDVNASRPMTESGPGEAADQED